LEVVVDEVLQQDDAVATVVPAHLIMVHCHHVDVVVGVVLWYKTTKHPQTQINMSARSICEKNVTGGRTKGGQTKGQPQVMITLHRENERQDTGVNVSQNRMCKHAKPKLARESQSCTNLCDFVGAAKADFFSRPANKLKGATGLVTTVHQHTEDLHKIRTATAVVVGTFFTTNDPHQPKRKKGL
jgi:hypothetical protein